MRRDELVLADADVESDSVKDGVKAVAKEPMKPVELADALRPLLLLAMRISAIKDNLHHLHNFGIHLVDLYFRT